MGERQLSNTKHAIRCREKYNKRKEQGICTRCGEEKADTGFCTCSKCRSKNLEEQRKSTEFYIGIGICPVCRKNKIFKGERKCPECKANATIHWSKYISPERKSTNNLTAHERYLKRKELGLCVTCGKKKIDDGYVRCPKCREKNKMNYIRYKERMKAV